MSSLFLELSVSSSFLWLAKATLLLVVAWVVHFLLRTANPRWQVYLWRTSLVGLIVLPAVGLVIPNWQIDIPAERPISGDEPLVGRVADATPFAVPSPSPDLPLASALPEVDTSSRPRSADVSVLQMVKPTAGEVSVSTVDWRLGAVLVWLTVVAFLLLRLVQSSLKIRRLVQSSVAAEANLIEIAQQALKDAGLRKFPEIRMSTSEAVPFVAGLFRPVVVLPVDVRRTANDSELKLILSHEFGHVAGRDLPWSMFAWIVRSIFWFHPLVWRLPAAHQIACETVCDALATRDDSMRATYRSLLAKLALRINGQQVVNGSVAMSATAEITRRLRRLRTHIPSESLSCRGRLMAIIASLVVVITMAAATLVPRAAADEAATPADGNAATVEPVGEVKAWTIRLNAIDADTGSPIAGPEFTVQLGKESTVHQGSDDGSFSAVIPSRTPRYCYLKVNAEGYTPMRAFWANRSNRTRDELAEELTFRMTRGITVGGIVVDEENQPVAGATVLFSAGARTPEERIEQSFHREEYTTDEQGRWRCPIAPREMNSTTFNVNHPDYARVTSNYGIDQQIDQLKAQTYSWTLKKGFAIRGVVTGPDGSPVEGAHLAVGTLNSYNDDGPFAITDADGRYEFPRIGSTARRDNSQRPYQMSVTVLRKGLAPQMAVVPGTGELQLEPSTWDERTIDFQLDEGSPLTIRVTDSQGKPVEKVWIFASEWRDGTEGLRVLREHGIPQYTDDDGVWRWDNAPTGEDIKYDILGRGFMDIRDEAFVAGDNETVRIALMRPLILQGHVIDVDTREPIDEFVIQQGFDGKSRDEYPDGVLWANNNLGRGGRYRRVVSTPRSSYRWKFVAKGYKAFASDSIPVGEGDFTLNVELKKISHKNEEPDRKDKAAILKQISALGGTTSNKLDTYHKHLPGFPVVRISFAKSKNVTDEFLKSLDCFDRLEQLDLSNTRITNAGLVSISEFTGLRSLGLSGTQVTDDGLTELLELSNLTRLAIQSSQVTDAGLKTIAAHGNLRQLYLFNTKITDSGMRELKKLRHLTRLSIARTPVTDAGLEELLSLQELEMLLLSETQVTDQGLKRLALLPKLNTLNLNATPITDVGLTHLVELKQLETLYLHKVPGITKAGVDRLRKARPELHIGQ